MPSRVNTVSSPDDETKPTFKCSRFRCHMEEAANGKSEIVTDAEIAFLLYPRPRILKAMNSPQVRSSRARVLLDAGCLPPGCQC